MTFTDENPEPTDTSVRVAARIRPQNAKERVQMNQICTSVTPNEPQIFMGKDKAFTFDYVFNMSSKQEEIFTLICKPLIDGCLEGYNATILAYGQTGSGKTYTMGSGFDVSLDNLEVGIIPRAVQYLFNRIDQMQLDCKCKGLPLPDFKIVAQFLELYNEELIDLLDMPENKNLKSHIKIHENTGGSIYLTGVSTRLVMSMEDTLKCLKDGTLCRSTASTNMNSQSSRSHAIFTLHIKQQRLIDSTGDMEISTHSNTGNNATTEFETLTAKFHFVDLAGSERLKRTGATGDRAKEGISINCGLLALGNVISTLGDRTKRGQHVPYRNSKLTRLLQDSLGGNSQTIMIACISPSDCDFLETLNTLNYANRARNIKNRITVNQDKTSKQLASMRQQIEALQAELNEYKMGKRLTSTEEGASDLYSENSLLQTENQSLRIKIKALANTIDTLKARNAQILAEKETYLWNCKKESTNLDEISLLDVESEEILKIIDKYTKEVEDMRAKLAETEAMVSVLQRSSMHSNMDSRQSHVAMSGEFPDTDFSVFDSVLEESYIISPKHRKRNRDSRKPGVSSTRGIINNGTGADTDAEMLTELGDYPINVGAGDAGTHALMSASDIDKDSLNGDADEGADVGEEDSLADEEAEEEDGGDEDDDDEESDTDNQDAENYLHRSLATLSSEIDVKRRLIEELQAKQKQLRKIRSHYEQQLEMLQNKIKETENERDQVLANLGEVEVTSEERVRKVKQDYEKKLMNLKTELNQLQTAKREHTLMLRNQQRKDQELRQLQKELNDLKSLKVQMSKKLREEAKRSRQIETSSNREIVQLRKEKRLKDNHIRTLEQDKQRRDTVLKRKQEELESLRKRSQTMTLVNRNTIVNTPNNRTTFSNVVGNITNRSTMNNMSHSKRTTGASAATNNVIPIRQHIRRNSVLAKVTKSKLDAIECALKKTVSRKHTINSYERDMNTRVKEREKLSRKLQRLEKKRGEFLTGDKNLDNILYNMTNIRAQIESIQEDITECQSNILEFEEAKLDESVSDIIAKCSLDEAQYLLDQVFQMAINKGLLAENLESQEASLRYELETKFQEREQALDMLRIALQHSTVPFDVDGLFAGSGNNDNLNVTTSEEEDDDNDEVSIWNSNVGSGPSIHSTETDLMQRSATAGSRNPHSKPDSLIGGDVKRQVSKRKPATPEELLGVNKTADKSDMNLTNLDNNNNSSFIFNSFRKTPTTIAQTPTETTKGLISSLGPNSTKYDPGESMMTSIASSMSSTNNTPIPSRQNSKTPQTNYSTSQVPRSPNRKPLTWKHPGGSMTTSLIVSKGTSVSEEPVTGSETPPMSPSNFRRAASQRTQNDDNVFKRLTTTRPSPNPKKGSINTVSRKVSVSSNSPLICSYVADGHHKAVLDVDVFKNIMITGSKDRTAKIWDLVNMVETSCLTEHQNSVTKVRYAPQQQMAFTVCTYYIKMWDLRQSACVRTLWSSGLSQEGGPDIGGATTSGSSSVSNNSRQAICPPPGENFIMDIALAQNCNMMFLATANSVKLWDMRQRYCAVGKLHGNHQAPVMVLAAGDRNMGRLPSSTTLVTGSKDHYIKVFEVDSGSVGLITPSQELQPPHYDGVEALVMHRANGIDTNNLFSGSRDACIKKWNLNTGQCITSLSQAHRDWVQALCIAEYNGSGVNDGDNIAGGYCSDLLISGCRSGVIKVWNSENCSYFGDVQAHESGITSLRYSSDNSSIYSASNDGKVKIWRVSSNIGVDS